MIVFQWLWAFIHGFLTVALIFCQWLAVLGIAFALIGIIRKRSKWYFPIGYLLMGLVFHYILVGIYGLSEKISGDDPVSTVIYWSASGIGVLAVLRTAKGAVLDFWHTTNTPDYHPTSFWYE